MSPYQVLVPALSLICLLYAWSLVQKNQKTIWEASWWTLFWGGIALIAIYPASIRFLSTFLGIQDQETAIIVTAIGLLFFIVFKIYNKLDAIEQRQTKIIREFALKNADKK